MRAEPAPEYATQAKSRGVPDDRHPGPIRLQLPATSANLGPGFDAVGLAMSILLRIDARIASEFSIAATGRDSELTGSLTDNLVLNTYREIVEAAGRPAPPLAVDLDNQIPLGKGCGSSAAALCAGALLANHFGALGWTPEQVLDEAARREGHPDNIAACLLGGLTVSKMVALPPFEGSGAAPTTHTVTATVRSALDWRLLLVLPKESLSTARARAMLPSSYPREDAVRNLQSTALLVAAFAQGRPELLTHATDDALHQPYRMAACPLLGALLPLAGTAGVRSVTLSGAGPSVLLIVDQAFAASDLLTRIGDGAAEIIETHIAQGATLHALPK